MGQSNDKNVFSRIGFAQVAGIIATMIVGRLVLTPLVTESNIEKTFEVVGASGLLLMIYIPQIAYLLAYWLVVRPMPVPEWQKETLGFMTIAKIFLMMYAASGVINQIGAAITKTSPAGETMQLEVLSQMQTTKLPVAIMIPVVIGPILEELIFRKLMLDRTRAYGEKTAIIFSAICFGLFHGNLTQFLYAGCVGLFLGYVYCKTGKVLYTMILHALLNLFSSLIMLAGPMLGNGATGLLLLFGLGFAILTMFVLGFIHLIRHLKNKDLRTDESMLTVIPKGEVLKTVYLNPCVALFVLLSTGGIIMDLMKITV